MKLKKFLAVLLCVATLTAALPALPATAASFPDIEDATVAEAAEFLRLLGIINGMDDGTYQPNQSLTRAQFCRLAVDLRGEGAQAAAYERYTYFTDVKGDHWARGYINYASRIVVGENERLVAGVGDGSFQPDRPITQAEAITMSLRLLGYAQSDVGMGGVNWYDGYIATARALGLLTDIQVSGDTPLDRGNAALLFRNLLYATPKAGKETFFATLGGKITDEVILLSVNATTQDGTDRAVMVRLGEVTSTYKTDHAPFDPALCGRRVTLIQDKDGKVLDMKPSTRGTVRTVTLAAHEAAYITDAAGERYAVDGSAPLYRGEKQSKYSEVYMDLKAGSALTLSYDVLGKLEYIYMPDTGEDTQTAVARVTCIYEDASPSPRSPLTITALGGTTLTVLPQAVEELAVFKPGDTVSLLLTAEGKVAGALKPASDTRSTLVGVVTAAGDGSATVETILTDSAGKNFTFTGNVSSSAEKLVGELVTVSSSRSGYLTLSKITSSASTGALNVPQRTLGNTLLSDRVALYERTYGSAPKRISWSQITVSSVPAAKISYVGTDLNGDIDIIILNDVTGDGFTYGYMSTRIEEVTVEPLNDGDPKTTYNRYHTVVENSSGKHELPSLSSTVIRSTPGGMAAATNGMVGTTVELVALSGVSRSAFDIQNMTVTVGGITYPIAQNVECYNKTTGHWFGTGATGLNAARAYAETMTLYYDKSPAQGGKIRLIVVG
ncbi:MAG: S-layer homology domain-containing protein [Oscillospiraceae bacterium]|nr:S-layer homology domain-containing protein [Oscillospiraceae bacterium]